MKRRISILIPIVLAGVIIILIGIFVSHRSTTGRIRHVLLISIDTCRADHVGCYGYPGDITPNIDAVARDGVVFERVVSPVPLTFPSHSSILTGTIPPYHGILDNYGYVLDDSLETLAEVFKKAGYVTGAIVSTFVLDSNLGLKQGFDAYADYNAREMGLERLGAGRLGEEASQMAITWLEKFQANRSFLFLHYYDPHTPYEPPEPFASKFKENPYAGEIAYADHCVGQVINKLKELDLYDKTLLIITSDHGEMLGEHGEEDHGYFIYESAIKVPLIIKPPGRIKPGRIKQNVSLVDIVPTICGSLDIEPPSPLHGRDLNGLINNKSASNEQIYIFTQSMTPANIGANSLLGVVNGDWKYIQTTRPELYNTVADPGEENNLADTEIKRMHLLKENLKLILDEQVRAGGAGQVSIDEQRRQQLESLGYLAGAVNSTFDFDQTRTDPKDLIQIHQYNKKAKRALIEKKYDLTRQLCDKILKEKPDFILAYDMLGQIAYIEEDWDKSYFYFSKVLDLSMANERRKEDDAVVYGAHKHLAVIDFQQKNYDQAIEHWKTLLALKPGQLEVYNNLGKAFFMLEKYEQSLVYWGEALGITPQDPQLEISIAEALLRLDRPTEAIEHWKKALLLKPDQPQLLNALGKILAIQGEQEQAIEYWNKTLLFDADNYEVHFNLALAYERRQEWDKAIEHWSHIARIKPGQADVYNNLGKLFYQQNQITEAVKQWRLALQYKTDFPEVLNNLAWLYATREETDYYNPAEALKLARRACELTDYKSANMLDTLSVACAAVGDMTQAITIARQAQSIYNNQGDDSKVEDIEKRIESYTPNQEDTVK
ncbi:MAG: sulfatase-like hydrolase/transferase [Sedimentisphaerales bacterium]|nr:sulfatase-like hydrolase/transferase [Sedimentisphaerales bacterium]